MTAQPSSSKNTNISEMLQARGSRYGGYFAQVTISTALVKAVENTPGWADMQDDQRQALREIFTKIARMCNGDPHYPDNWVDIEGYARLVRVRLEEEGPPVVQLASPSSSEFPKLLQKFEVQSTQQSAE